MHGKMTPEKARALRDEVVKGHHRRHPSVFVPQPGTLKHRVLRLDPGHAEHLHTVRQLLEGLQGLVVADGPHAHSLTIWYEVTEFTLSGLEKALARQGINLDPRFHARLTRMLIGYCEETQLRNMRVPERLIKKSHEVYSRAWEHHPHGDHDDTPADLRKEN